MPVRIGGGRNRGSPTDRVPAPAPVLGRSGWPYCSGSTLAVTAREPSRRPWRVCSLDAAVHQGRWTKIRGMSPSAPEALPIDGAELVPAVPHDAGELLVLQRCCW